jgi:hypothetical protein
MFFSSTRCCWNAHGNVDANSQEGSDWTTGSELREREREKPNEKRKEGGEEEEEETSNPRDAHTGATPHQTHNLLFSFSFLFIQFVCWSVSSKCGSCLGNWVADRLTDKVHFPDN